MIRFFTLSVFVFCALNLRAQCPVFWADDTAILQDETAVWVIDEISDCDEKEAKHPLSIFPNPTTDFFEVKNWVNKDGLLFDVIGRLVRRIDFSNIIDVSDLPKGLYFIQANQMDTQKLVVQ